MTLRTTFLFTLLAAFCLAQLPCPAADSPRAKVLVVTGGHGFDKEPFFKMFAENPAITFTNLQHSRGTADAFDRADLAAHDVVVLYDMNRTITESQKQRFLSMFERGTGLVVMHHALVSYQDWPDYERIIGGNYPEPKGKEGVVTPELGYEHDVEFPVQIVAKDHPITRGLKDFVILDEIYWGYRVGKDVTPLITTTHPKSGKPLAWARTEKKSRVVYLQLGHGPTAFTNQNFRAILAQSIHWTANQTAKP